MIKNFDGDSFILYDTDCLVSYNILDDTFGRYEVLSDFISLWVIYYSHRILIPDSKEWSKRELYRQSSIVRYLTIEARYDTHIINLPNLDKTLNNWLIKDINFLFYPDYNLSYNHSIINQLKSYNLSRDSYSLGIKSYIWYKNKEY